MLFALFSIDSAFLSWSDLANLCPEVTTRQQLRVKESFMGPIAEVVLALSGKKKWEMQEPW